VRLVLIGSLSRWQASAPTLTLASRVGQRQSRALGYHGKLVMLGQIVGDLEHGALLPT